jgi:hypothetical protein
MFCPTCESEYEAGITRCPDDDSPLVERLTPENTVHDSSEARFLSFIKLGSPAEAEMVNDIFSQNDVRSVVKSGGADAFSPTRTARLNSTTPFSAGTQRRSPVDQLMKMKSCNGGRRSHCSFPDGA